MPLKTTKKNIKKCWDEKALKGCSNFLPEAGILNRALAGGSRFIQNSACLETEVLSCTWHSLLRQSGFYLAEWEGIGTKCQEQMCVEKNSCRE